MIWYGQYAATLTSNICDAKANVDRTSNERRKDSSFIQKSNIYLLIFLLLNIDIVTLSIVTMGGCNAMRSIDRSIYPCVFPSHPIRSLIHSLSCRYDTIYFFFFEKKKNLLFLVIVNENCILKTDVVSSRRYCCSRISSATAAMLHINIAASYTTLKMKSQVHGPV